MRYRLHPYATDRPVGSRYLNGSAWMGALGGIAAEGAEIGGGRARGEHRGGPR